MRLCHDGYMSARSAKRTKGANGKSKKHGAQHGATPAINACEAAGIEFTVHQFPHSDNNFGQEAAHWLETELGVEADRVFKTLVIELFGKKTGLAVAIVPATERLNLKAAAAALGASKADLADPHAATNATGYIPGGISPLGQRRKLPTVMDEIATVNDTIFVSGGRRGWDIELSPSDLEELTGATIAAIAK